MRILAFSGLQRDAAAARARRHSVEATPWLNLCGHIRHAWGMTDDIGDTRVHNPGPGLTWFGI